MTTKDIDPTLDELTEWITQAAPMLSTAACIIIQEAIDRLDEIAGVRALLESCPIDYEDQP